MPRFEFQPTEAQVQAVGEFVCEHIGAHLIQTGHVFDGSRIYIAWQDAPNSRVYAVEITPDGLVHHNV